MSRLTLTEVESIRNIPGQSLLLFITDRCPVGCAHCSVDSRKNSPTITNFPLFESIIIDICTQPKLSLIGISGGEPFVEQQGLVFAVDRLAKAGKEIALYTSGIWATSNPPKWIRSVIRQASCVYLSTDAFHSETVNDDRFVRAIQAIAKEDTWVIVQVLNLSEMVQKVQILMQRAFDGEYNNWAEISLIPPLPYGRGRSLFARPQCLYGKRFGPCNLLGSPVVRYDGIVSACCNEEVIMGGGSERLRQRCTIADQMGEILEKFTRDPVLQVINKVGPGALTYHPQYANLAQQKFASTCDLCWSIQKQSLPLGDCSNQLLNAITLLEQEEIK
jgi:organic radical activating enzyme